MLNALTLSLLGPLETRALRKRETPLGAHAQGLSPHPASCFECRLILQMLSRPCSNNPIHDFQPVVLIPSTHGAHVYCLSCSLLYDCPGGQLWEDVPGPERAIEAARSGAAQEPRPHGEPDADHFPRRRRFSPGKSVELMELINRALAAPSNPPRQPSWSDYVGKVVSNCIFKVPLTLYRL